HWAARTRDEMTLLDQQLTAQAAGSGMANQLGATLRIAESMRQRGTPLGGRAGQLVDALRSRQSTFAGGESVFQDEGEWRRLMTAAGVDPGMLGQFLSHRDANQRFAVESGTVVDLVRRSQLQDIQDVAALGQRTSVVDVLGRFGIRGDRAERLAGSASAAGAA